MQHVDPYFYNCCNISNHLHFVCCLQPRYFLMTSASLWCFLSHWTKILLILTAAVKFSLLTYCMPPLADLLLFAIGKTSLFLYLFPHFPSSCIYTQVSAKMCTKLCCWPNIVTPLPTGITIMSIFKDWIVLVVFCFCVSVYTSGWFPSVVFIDLFSLILHRCETSLL